MLGTIAFLYVFIGLVNQRQLAYASSLCNGSSNGEAD